MKVKKNNAKTAKIEPQTLIMGTKLVPKLLIYTNTSLNSKPLNNPIGHFLGNG